MERVHHVVIYSRGTDFSTHTHMEHCKKWSIQEGLISLLNNTCSIVRSDVYLCCFMERECRQPRLSSIQQGLISLLTHTWSIVRSDFYRKLLSIKNNRLLLLFHTSYINYSFIIYLSLFRLLLHMLSCNYLFTFFFIICFYWVIAEFRLFPLQSCVLLV